MNEREQERQPFAVTSIEQLNADYTWGPKTALLQGGEKKFLETLKEKINKEGGLTQEDLQGFGIVSNETKRPKTDLLEGKGE